MKTLKNLIEFVKKLPNSEEKIELLKLIDLQLKACNGNENAVILRITIDKANELNELGLL